MFDRNTFLEDCVITCISDDYENFDIIFRHARRWAAHKGLKISHQEVASALESAIAHRYADAYVLSARPAEARRVEYAPSQLGELWFYVTPLGKEKAKSVDQLIGGSCRGKDLS